MKHWLLFVFLFVIFGCETVCYAQFLTPQDIVKLPSTLADKRINYGTDALQFGELRLPKTQKSRVPVAVVIHGGCWLASYADLKDTDALSSTLAAAGIATWNIEYRRADSPGGGWTGTFQDVSLGVDYLQTLAKTYPLDLKRVVIIGHSAGGHLALWAGGRSRLPKDSPLYVSNPLRVRGVINLAGPGDLRSAFARQKESCNATPITKLLGGAPEEVPDRYKISSPADLLPLRVKQVLIVGAEDKILPPKYVQEYEKQARESGDKVTLQVIENTGHFEVIAPGTKAWSTVEDAVKSMLKIKNSKPEKSK